jgi:hypothetical protein
MPMVGFEPVPTEDVLISVQSTLTTTPTTVFCQKILQIQFFMSFSPGIPVLEKSMMKNLQKIPFGEGQVQDPIPALPGHGSEIKCRYGEKIGNRRTDRNDFNIAYF